MPGNTCKIGSALAPIPKRRVLRVGGDEVQRRVAEVCQVLIRVKGIATTLDVSGKLVVEYDLAQVTFEQIEPLILSAGLQFHGKLHELQRSWWKYTEKNELENVRRPVSHCCNKPPVA